MRTPATRSAAKRLVSGSSPNPLASYTKLALAIAAVLSGGSTVYGATATTANDSDSDSTLEQIVVTARKRTENLQDVPMSIDVFTSKDLANQAISNSRTTPRRRRRFPS